MRQLSVIFDMPEGSPYYNASVEAVEHAVAAAGADLPVVVVRTPEIDDDFVASFAGGVVIGPGTPYDEPHRADEVIRSARERGVPLVGT